MPTLSAKTNPITDLVLIYDGGEGHPNWPADRFKPYVYREENGKFDWLFDGFLFIERYAMNGAQFCPLTNRKPAMKADWQALIDHYFRDGQSIGALNDLLSTLAAEGHKPARKRQVVIVLPTPFCGIDPARAPISSPWGKLDGKRLDFERKEDRLRAAQWYVDTVLERWKTKNYQHLELAGFYWLFERAWTTHSIPEISRYINSKNLHLYWIPSWPQGRTNWPQYGFDFVYQQPNYFFHRQPTPFSRLEDACKFAERCGTTMEMEFNKDLLKKPAFLTYFDQYLAAYDKHHVWEKRPVAYYEGGGAWFDMAYSSDPAVKRRYKAMADIIVGRQRKADAGFIFRQDAR